ncbi:hypothetical protein [Butyrivibrio sp. AD3002]|uniref:hypothetical protein n=1 Tax=Butyrivibrio sp. AD3002 TaxID=1280670 RepID=UPI0003B391B8|nr:hypothetical protein [Butyrivibrio sp. AD3002]
MQKSNMRAQDEKDLKMIRDMKNFADQGFDLEFRKASGGGYKILKVKKQILTTD